MISSVNEVLMHSIAVAGRWVKGCIAYSVVPRPRGGCAPVIMHHELATPIPIGPYKKFIQTPVQH